LLKIACSQVFETTTLLKKRNKGAAGELEISKLANKNSLAKEQRHLRMPKTVRGFDSNWTWSQIAESKKKLLARCGEARKIP